jgi:hypothetical protein
MINLAKLLRKDVSTIFRKPRKQGAQLDPNQQFTRLEASGRVIRSYGGILPSSGGRARHILRCEHLRELPGEGLQPYRAEPNFTHQIWLWYRMNDEPDRLYLLFRGQFDFRMMGYDLDWIAGEIADFLAYLLLNCDEVAPEIFRNQYSDQFWSTAVSRKFEYLEYTS